MSTTPPLARPWLVTACAVCRVHGSVLYRVGARENAAITQEKRSRWTRQGELAVCPDRVCQQIAGLWWDLEIAKFSGTVLEGPEWDAARVSRLRAVIHEEPARDDDRPWWRRWFVSRA